MAISKRYLTSLLVGTLAATPALAADPVKIGVSQPLTGAVAASGNYVTNGARLAAAEINENGGLLGRQLELIIEDNKSNPREAVNAAEKLILRDKVPVIMGAWSSTYTLATMPKLEEYGVPMVVETSSSSKITTAGNPWIFRIAPTSAMEAQAFAKNLSSFNPPIKKVDFLSVNNDWGLGASQEFEKMFKANGIEIGQKETVAPDTVDLSAQLSALKDTGSDTLIMTSGVEQLTLGIRQAAEQQLPQRIVTTGGSFPEPLLESPGPKGYTSSHLLFFSPWTPESAVHPEIAGAFVDAWNEAGYSFPGLSEGFRGYDGIMTIAAAIEDAGSTESEAIRAALWNVQVEGVNGDISFFKQGPAGKESGQNEPNVYVVQLKDGKVSAQ
ncbi:ABC transporter substrate-binding protein [Marinobacter sp.]|uniref:ABC transporter substrate-binding protein n=1 Tax=Marinobacter sp. TaxID=50741 RepID=UPI002B27741C|nr:ABC transporter substrate-binding protein [Marinobacter sp.]